jgi:hypothetical protein
MADDPESMFVQHLRRIAGVDQDKYEFALRSGDVTIRVYYSGGSSSYLSLIAPYPDTDASRPAIVMQQPSAYRAPSAVRLAAARPLQIKLTHEGASEVASKASGIDREFQTGDASFDDHVYIDAPCEDEALVAVFASREVRTSVMALLGAGFPEVLIDNDDGCISVRVSNFPSLGREDAFVRGVVDAFATLVRSLPSIENAGKRRTGSSGWMTLGGIAAFVLSIGSCANACNVARPGCEEGNDDGTSFAFSWRCLHSGFFGAVAGVGAFMFAFVVVGKVVRPRLSGRSDSSSRILGRAFLGGVLAYDVVSLAVAWLSR